MSPGNKELDDELDKLLRQLKQERIRLLETDPVYKAALNWQDKNELDKVLKELISKW